MVNQGWTVTAPAFKSSPVWVIETCAPKSGLGAFLVAHKVNSQWQGQARVKVSVDINIKHAFEGDFEKVVTSQTSSASEWQSNVPLSMIINDVVDKHLATWTWDPFFLALSTAVDRFSLFGRSLTIKTSAHAKNCTPPRFWAQTSDHSKNQSTILRWES